MCSLISEGLDIHDLVHAGPNATWHDLVSDEDTVSGFGVEFPTLVQFSVRRREISYERSKWNYLALKRVSETLEISGVFGVANFAVYVFGIGTPDVTILNNL